MPELAAGPRADRALRGFGAAPGWGGIKNGALLALAEQNQFDVFLTGDRNLAFQQNTTRFRIAVIVLEADGIQLHHTLPLMPKVLAALPSLTPGQVVRMS